MESSFCHFDFQLLRTMEEGGSEVFLTVFIPGRCLPSVRSRLSIEMNAGSSMYPLINPSFSDAN